MSYDSYLHHEFCKEEDRQQQAERAERIRDALWASNVLLSYFGQERMRMIYERLGLEGCLEVAEAIDESIDRNTLDLLGDQFVDAIMTTDKLSHYFKLSPR